MTTSHTALVLAVAAGALLLAACGAGPGSGSGAGGGTEPASTSAGCLPGGGPDDGEALAGVVGLTEADAVARAESLGLTTRVAGRGAECFALTMDLQPDRLNLDLDDDGVVRGASRG